MKKGVYLLLVPDRNYLCDTVWLIQQKIEKRHVSEILIATGSEYMDMCNLLPGMSG
jgi:hypothetical protein